LAKNQMKQKYTEKEAAAIFSKVVRGIKFLHSKGIIHRDIKPENIMLTAEEDDLDIRIADFNLSKLLLGEDYTTTVLGTMGYCAPEVISHKPYTFSVDIWSLGVLLYIILVGFPPFPLGRDPMAPIKTKQGKFSFPKPHWDHISEDAKELIRKMLVLDPQMRISLVDIQSHSWMQKFGPPIEEEVPVDLGSRPVAEEMEKMAAVLNSIPNSTRPEAREVLEAADWHIGTAIYILSSCQSGTGTIKDAKERAVAIRQGVEIAINMEKVNASVSAAGVDPTTEETKMLIKTLAKEVVGAL